MTRVLLVCYAIEAGRGSEEGSGFNYARSLLAQPDVELTLVTRTNNVDRLRRDGLLGEAQLVAHDPPRWLTFWKRGGRGIIAFYYIWQWTARRKVREVLEATPADVIHQYNFHTDWAPHFLHGLGVPVVWGPICHQPPLPAEYFTSDSRINRVKDLLRTLVKQTFWRLDPSLRRAARRTDVVLYANRDIAPPFRNHPDLRQQTFGGAAFIDEVAPSNRGADDLGLQFLHVGRMTAIKGAPLALDAFLRFRERGGRGRLTLVGEGELDTSLRETAAHSGFATDVVIMPWMAQQDLADVYADADVFLYPSLGNQDTVVAEALRAGLPVVCIAGSGTETMAGPAAITVPRRGIVDELASQMLELDSGERRTLEALSRAASSRASLVSWEGTATAVRHVYDELATS